MHKWWYANKDKKSGPLELDELKQLLQTGKITLSTMVWHEGMESWTPLKDVEELEMIRASIPPPVPAETATDPLTNTPAGPWFRYFARLFDLWWEEPVVVLIVGTALGHYSATYIRWINSPGSAALLALFSLPGALLLDAIVYRIAGNTPGKAILGLKVGALDGTPLSLAQYIRRNLSLWVSGLALGIPLIGLVTCVIQYQRLRQLKQASYDESPGYRVRAQPIGALRKIALGFSFAALVVALTWMNVTNQKARYETASGGPPHAYHWQNPITDHNAKIASIWRYHVKTNAEGEPVYMFSEHTGHALVVFAMEKAPGFSLDEYARSFQRGTAKTMHFTNGGYFSLADGHQAWKDSGNLILTQSNHLTVQVRQYGPEFWRVVTIQGMPYDYTKASVAKLRDSLWTTIK